MCAAIFKKKNVVGEKASKSAYDYSYPPILKLYPLNISLYGKPDFAAVSRRHNMHITALSAVCRNIVFNNERII